MNPSDHSLRAAPPRPAPPTDRLVKCALSTCDATFRITDSYNFIITMAKRGPDERLAGFQCPDPAEVAAGNLEAQHFCCTPEHALMAAFLCARDHIIPQHLAEVQALAQADAAEVERQAAKEAARNTPVPDEESNT